MSGRFYAILPDEIGEYNSLEEAEKAAHKVIDEGGDNGWDDGIEGVEYGMLVPLAVTEQFDLRMTPNGEWDFTCDYRLVPTATQALYSRIEELHARQMLAVYAFATVLEWVLNHRRWVDAADDSSGSMSSTVAMIESRFLGAHLLKSARGSVATLTQKIPT